MKPLLRLFTLAVLPACVFILLSLPASAQSAGLRVLYSAGVRMRDGLNLAADIYLPKAEGKYPVVLYRTPYNPRNPSVYAFAEALTARGFVLVVNHCRGRYDSPGDWKPYEHEGEDGFDTVQWIVSQPWCNGRVGTTGASYSSNAQLQLAALHNPHVQAMFIVVPPVDIYHDAVYPGGAFALRSECTWLNWVARRTDQEFKYQDFDAACRHLPVSAVDEQLGRQLPVFQEHLSHRQYDAFWQQLNPVKGIVGQDCAPMLLVDGWNDAFATAVLNLYNKLGKDRADANAAEDHLKVIIGPWDHMGTITGLVTKFGDIDYGQSAKLDVTAAGIDWFDRWLKDEKTGTTAPVKYFLTGSNIWKESQCWPPQNSKDTRFYLHSSGKAVGTSGDGILNTSTPGNEPADKFAYDPASPVPSLNSQHVIFVTGSQNMHTIESRKDVLTYTSEPLQSDLEVAGNARVILNFSSDAPDTDFTAWLTDVLPDGRSICLQDGISRCSQVLFNGKANLKLDNVYEISIELGALAHVFQTGHRVRVCVSSSDFPAFERNLNTGRNSSTESTFRIANQTLHHRAQAASRLVLPVVSPAVANSN